VTAALEALGSLVFRPYERPDDVWRDDVVHVDGLHSEAFGEILHRYRQLKAGNDVANVVIEGRPGVGKTHFLGRLRAHVVAEGDFFVLVQLSSARQFWESLVVQYLSAFARPNAGGQTQLARWSAAFFKTAELGEDECERASESMVRAVEIVSLRPRLRRYLGNSPERHAALDVAIALLLQASEDYHAQDVGRAFLVGPDIEPEDKQRYGFQALSLPPQEVIATMDFLVAKAGMVSVVCVDQLDGLIAITQRDGENSTADALLLDQIANGLMDIAQECSNSLIALSCLRPTWERIRNKTVQSAAARYPAELKFGAIPSPKVGEALIAAYFNRAYRNACFTPPYSTWPIKPTAFRDAQSYTPRRLIELSEAHARKCRQTRVITELEAFPGADTPATEEPPRPNGGSASETSLFETIDADFAAARDGAVINGALDEVHVDAKLPALLQAGLAAWIDENSQSDTFSVDGLPDRNAPLHARLRQTLNFDTEEEVHWSLRAIVSAHHTAALTRLRTAMTVSGLGLAPGKRNLIILRNQDWSAGPKTQAVLSELGKLGGVTRQLDLADLAVFDALNRLRQRHGEAITPWLRARRPASKTALLEAVLGTVGAPPVGNDPSPTNGATGTNGHSLGVGPAARLNGVDGPTHEPPIANPPAATETTSSISLGASPGTGESIDVRLEDLRRHTAIFAGSGSGKTVLIRRLIEECALAGISSIVLDPNNDLARLGTPWPQPPAGWLDGDAERAQRYFDGTEVVIWTPRRTTGRPLTFQPMGDLSAVIDDPDEFDVAIDNAVATLLPRAGLPKSGAKADQGQAVLREALRYFVRNGGSGLKPFLAFLDDLPADVSSIADATKLAHAMAQTLIAATVNDPLFGGEGVAVDPGVLLTPSPGKTARVSVVSLIGLNDDHRPGFVNQLQMALFAWAKKNPAGDRPLGGLYVMDEAQTFAPSSPTTVCTQSTLALAAQARKYGLGLVFATQAPKGLHNRIVGNATTQLYGFMNAPAQIAAVKEIAAAKGGDVPDISRLKPGLFYIGSDAIALQKIATPNCLSYHPKSPLTPMEVLALASAK
jgi:Helicase HerA, central domain